MNIMVPIDIILLTMEAVQKDADHHAQDPVKVLVNVDVIHLVKEDATLLVKEAVTHHVREDAILPVKEVVILLAREAAMVLATRAAAHLVKDLAALLAKEAVDAKLDFMAPIMVLIRSVLFVQVSEVLQPAAHAKATPELL